MNVSRLKKIAEKQGAVSPNLIKLVEGMSGNGARFDETLLYVDRENTALPLNLVLKLASNKRLSKALVESSEWETIKDAFPCWSGTMTAYVEPGRTFRDAVEETSSSSWGKGCFIRDWAKIITGLDWLFPVPEEYLDKKDAILVVEHPGYTIERHGINMIVRAARVGLVERFPAKDGYYLGDPTHDIPCGDEVGDSDKNARRLWRIDKRVGPVARNSAASWYGYWNTINLKEDPSERYGAAVEASLREPPKVVPTFPRDNDTLVKGVTLGEFRALFEDANARLQDVMDGWHEKNAAVQQFLKALEPVEKIIRRMRKKVQR